MMVRISKTLLTIILTVMMAVMPARANVTVTAKLDSVNLLMGNISMLHLEVVQDKGVKGEFPMFKNVDPNIGYVGVCGDSIELRTSVKADTVEVGSGRIQINCQVPVQAFDSGFYRLPPIVYVAGGDTARSNVVSLNVLPVKVTADDPIAGLATVADPEGAKFTDFVPDWMVDYWWIIALAVLAVAIAIWAVMRYRKEGTVLKHKPQPTPYEVAIKALRELKTKNLWEQGLEKEYFTRLTDILRKYLDRRFGINAMEMTSREIIEHLYDSDVKDKRDYVRQILNVADFVKFAKVRPLPADNIAAYENAVKFVEETKPQLAEPAPGETVAAQAGQNPVKVEKLGVLAPPSLIEKQEKSSAIKKNEAFSLKKGGGK